MPTIRPSDATGDILPILSITDLSQGPSTTAKLIQYRLKLLTGEWWEYPEQGNQILHLLQTTRLTEADAEPLTSYFSSYIADTPGVFSIENAETVIEGRRFRFSCTALTKEGNVSVSFSQEEVPSI